MDLAAWNLGLDFARASISALRAMLVVYRMANRISMKKSAFISYAKVGNSGLNSIITYGHLRKPCWPACVRRDSVGRVTCGGDDGGRTSRFLEFRGSTAATLGAWRSAEKLAATVDFELFRPNLSAALGPRDPAKGGRPGFDLVLKFRMLVLQATHGLSLEQKEYLVADRLSWGRFCGLGLQRSGS